MVYSGHHHEIATWPGMRERTITISSLSKTWSATGWRIGWIIAPPAQTGPIRKVHDFLTVGAPAPLQTAAAVGFAFDAEYYNQFTASYKQKRDYMCGVLRDAGFTFATPEGAYYIFADFSALSDLDDVTFAKWMTQEIGVATVPGSSFYSRKEDGRLFTRFAFCKKQETLENAAERLAGLKAAV
jgi:aminotransferase